MEQYTDPGSHDPRAMLLITASPALRDPFLDTAARIEHPLAAVIADRTGADQLTARVLAASVAAAVRVALGQWARPAAGSSAASGLITVSGSLAELLRAALAPLTPALDAAGEAVLEFQRARRARRAKASEALARFSNEIGHLQEWRERGW